jgi:hypothetical protein
MRRSTWRWLVAVVRVQVRRSPERVTCTGGRHALRATRAEEGGLRVEAAARADGRWRRVDDDLVALVRAILRVRLAAPAAFGEVVQGAVELAGVRLATEDGSDPVATLVRATYPLLAVEVGGRLPSLPATLPGHLQPAFRRPTPRAAAELLFDGRVTRPLLRAFGAAFAGRGVPDLFRVTVAAAVSGRLEPDQLVALLGAGATAKAGAPTAPLTADEMEGIAGLVDDLHPRRAMRLLTEGVIDTEGRERLRFVAAERAADGPRADEAADLEELALLVALRPRVGS